MTITNTSKFYAVVTLGVPGRAYCCCNPYTSEQAARRDGLAAKGTGTCQTVRIYECDSEALARSADISEVRHGERIIAAL